MTSDAAVAAEVAALWAVVEVATLLAVTAALMEAW